jgi:hypothetical protein
LLRVMTIAPALANFCFTGFAAIEVLFLVRFDVLRRRRGADLYRDPDLQRDDRVRFVLFGVMPLGALVGGALASAFGARTAVPILLIGNVTPGLVLAASPLRRMRDLPEGQTVACAVSPAAR